MSKYVRKTGKIDKGSGLPVPASVYKPRKAKRGPVVEVGESYFAVNKPEFDPERAHSGQLKDHTSFIKPTRHPETGELGYFDPGTLEPIEFRFGSTTHGRPERNRQKGYVVARRNPKTHELDPHGEPIVLNDAGKGGNAQLLVRRAQDGIAARKFQRELVDKRSRSKEVESLEVAFDRLKYEAKKLGIEENLVVKHKEREITFDPKSSKPTLDE